MKMISMTPSNVNGTIYIKLGIKGDSYRVTAIKINVLNVMKVT